MSFTNLGIGSGLPLNTLVEGLLNAERVPTELRLNARQENLQLELSGVGAFRSALSSFQDTLGKLTANNAFNQQTITTSNDNISVTTNGFASNGEFDVNVQQLASGTQLKSAAIASSATTLGSGTLTFTAGANNFTVDIDAADDLSAIRDKINAESGNFGVTANIINADSGTFLILNSTQTGSANNLSVTTSDPSLAAISTNNTVNTAAQDAIITVDGNTITNSSNEFKNIIEDVTITANALTTTENSRITIEQDTASARELVDEFVNSFNTLSTSLTGLAAPRQGRLAFDPNIRQIRQQITDVLLDTVSNSSVGNLQNLGIELDDNGLLQVSSFSSQNIASGSQRLSNALSDNLEEVGKLFASDDGVATRISAIVDTYVNSDGVLTQRQRSLNEQLEDVSEERAAFAVRLADFEQRLIAQFTALDSAVAGFNSTRDFVTNALRSSSSNNNSNN
ncbi:flagellar filament capping protein FliD [Endozoicomonas sp. G2_1]|uniref:flagellar filament capping protein FliD n=1 Tax=Endozoicomonas sp. G2_1 TaxID=2821091 RepID=UPI001ADBD510|nr:flagellar filament capping protein FliD [Endozoicomonas sp. G2_1]MBO9489064.1 flagellar filament capping protein FliD [Endozoicomonas sp. G2_1]